MKRYNENDENPTYGRVFQCAYIGGNKKTVVILFSIQDIGGKIKVISQAIV